MSLPPEILKKVKLLELNTRKLVNNVLTGEYHSAFKGQGMTFADFREYVHGDDIRNISWNITAKAGKPYIKRYDEERELTMLLMVDISGSGDFGSGEYLKGEVLVHLAAMLGFSAVKNGDHVGLLLFSDQVEHFVPPKKGHGNMHRILRDLLYFRPKSRKTSIQNAAEYIQGILKKQANIFILSDFYDSGFDTSIRNLSRKHDVTCVLIEDEVEHELPDIGFVEFHDAETGEVVEVDTSNPKVRKLYKEKQHKRDEERRRLLRNCQAELLEIPSTKNYVDPLIAYFRRRHK